MQIETRSPFECSTRYDTLVDLRSHFAISLQSAYRQRLRLKGGVEALRKRDKWHDEEVQVFARDERDARKGGRKGGRGYNSKGEHNIWRYDNDRRRG